MRYPSISPWLPQPGDEEPEKLRDLCLHGLCSVFAIELNARTGWPIAGLFAGYSRNDPPVHIVCVDPEGAYADAAGRYRSFDALCAEYNLSGPRRAVTPVDAESMQNRFRRDPAWRSLIAKNFDEVFENSIGTSANASL